MHATTPASTETDETRTSRSQRWERAAALLAIVALHVFYLLSMDTVEIITHHGIGGDGSEGSGQMTGAKRKSRFVVYNEENPRTFFLRRRTLPERTRRRKKPDDATSSAHNAIVAGPEGRNLVPLGAATKGSNSPHKQQRRKRQTPKQARHRRHKAVEADAADGDVDDADEATVITSPLSGRHRRLARRGGDGEGVPMEVFDRILKNGLYSDLRAEEENVSRRYHGRRTVPLITSTADPNRRRRHRHDDNVEDKLDRMLRKNLYTDLNRDTSRVPSSTSYSPRRRRRRHPQETDTSVGGEFDRMLPENLDGYLAADVITERHRTHLQPSSTTRNRHRRRRDSDDDRDVRKLFERMILRKNLFVEPEGRIVGGNEVRRRDYPYLVAVLQRQFNGRYAQRCGGALIAKNAVLSAAHCIPKADSVRIGAHRLEINNAAAGRSGVDDGSEGFDVVRTISHPDFDPVTLDNDFAIFVLGGNSTFPTIEVNSNPTEPIDGDDLRVLGWGVTRWGGAQSEVPREATVNRLADSLCSAKYDGSGAKITPKMLCAVAPQRDACQGDSGGPLVRRKRGVDALRGGGESQDVLVGLVSWGFGCANPSYPGVYARVSAVSSWINQTLQSFG